MSPTNDLVERRNISMYSAQWATVDQYAKDEGFTVSLAMRKIIMEWVELKARTLTDPPTVYTVEPQS